MVGSQGLKPARAGLLMAGVLLLLLAACSTTPPPPVIAAPEVAPGQSPWALASGAGTPPAAWLHQEFPGKRVTVYRYARIDGRDVIQAHAESSASVLRQRLRVEAADLGRLQFSWKVPALIADADLRDRHRSDSPVRIVLAFEGDRSRFSARDGMLSELAHALTGEPMPYATLMYVWANQTEPETLLNNARTTRIRKLVVESGPRNLNRWLDYDRDIRADFLQAFGEEPGALVSIGILTDTDNTESNATVLYGPVRTVPGR